MGKYNALTRYLQNQTADQLTLTMDEVETILGFKLKKSPRERNAWWANGGHDHAKTWLKANYSTYGFKKEKQISFKRISKNDSGSSRLPAERMTQNSSSVKYDYSKEWFYEGNIQRKIAEYLRDHEGYSLTSDPNRNIHQRGLDIEATKDSKTWWIEVKGYPSDKYVRDVPGGSIGEPKKTHPRVQARHWFGEALLTALRLKCNRPEHEIGFGFPEQEVYLHLLNELNDVTEKFNIHTYIVKEDGTVLKQR